VSWATSVSGFKYVFGTGRSNGNEFVYFSGELFAYASLRGDYGFILEDFAFCLRLFSLGNGSVGFALYGGLYRGLHLAVGVR
jgi:hypothetical protein